MKWLYFPMCDHHLAISEYTAAELELASKGHRVRRGVWICPMGVDCTRFTPARCCSDKRAQLLAQTGCPQGGRLLLYAGRLASEKNIFLLLDLMEQLPGGNHRMIIAGDGALRAEFARQADQRTPGLFHFLGHVAAREELADLYANCDLFVHPNPREPFGIAPLEAMASGVPLLAPNCGGLTAYADDDNAWLTPPDAKAFVTAAQRALDNGAEREAKVARARQTAEHYAWPAVAARYLSLYDELHRLTQSGATDPRTAPCFYSTPGDRLGREV
jgi:alpha-1,6-mannosyltransferase